MNRLAAALLLALVSCGPLGSFSVDVSQEGVIPGLASNIPGAGGPDLGNAGSQVSRTIKNKGVTKDLVRSIRVSAAQLVLLSPTNSNLSWLGGFRVKLASPGLETIVIAHLDDVTGLGPEYPLDRDDVDLTPYVTADEMTLSLDMDPPQSKPFPDHSVRLDLTFFVDLGSSG